MALEANIPDTSDWFTGEDKALVFTIYESDETTPQDITGWTVSWRLKRRQSDADSAALLTKTVGSGIALTTPLSGVLTVSIADTDTDAILAGSYFHELKRTTDGSETVLSFGSAVLKQALHRA